jgi:hypothetical protein
VNTITPSSFWQIYKAQIQQSGSWEKYHSSPQWTVIAKDAAIATCEKLGLKTSKEYFRLDVLGYDECVGVHHDWNARVAFEVENSAHWKDELCKLSHIVADLCVLAAYQWHKKWTAEESLSEYLLTLGDRALRVPGRQWLFIFGPHGTDINAPWTAYSLSETKTLVSVDIDPPLCGADLQAM